MATKAKTSLRRCFIWAFSMLMHALSIINLLELTLNFSSGVLIPSLQSIYLHWHCTWALELLDVCPYLSAYAVLFCFARHYTWALELLDMCPYLSTFVYFFFLFYNSIVGEMNLIHECLHCKHQEMPIELQSFVYYFCFANLVNKNWFSYCASFV